MKNFRQLVFWGLDLLRGGNVHKHYTEIEQDNALIRNTHLNEILIYAQEHVPFYRGKNFKHLEEFPVINKVIFKEQGINCISDEFPNYKSLHTVKTSGSTGTPLVLYLDPNKRLRVIADLLAINDKIGWKLGDHYVYLRSWTSNKRQSKLEKFAKNFLAVNIGDFDDDSKEQLYNYFMHHKNTVFVGYSCSVCDFMDWVNRTGRDGKAIKLKLIHCSAEELLESKRKELKETFGCPVYNRYSNNESGLLAMMEDDCDVFHVNTASLRIELLKLDSNEYVQPGEIGRVVVTDFFNHAMPLIRYDIGDLAISYDNSDDVKTIEKLCGRSADILICPDGRLISNAIAASIAETIQGISKWQLVQVYETKFRFSYIGKLSPDEKKELNRRMLEALGPNTEYEIVECKDLPLSKTGKFKTLVNELHK